MYFWNETHDECWRLGDGDTSIDLALHAISGFLWIEHAQLYFPLSYDIHIDNDILVCEVINT